MIMGHLLLTLVVYSLYKKELPSLRWAVPCLKDDKYLIFLLSFKY